MNRNGRKNKIGKQKRWELAESPRAAIIIFAKVFKISLRVFVSMISVLNNGDADQYLNSCPSKNT